MCVNVLLDVCMCAAYHGCLASAEVRKRLWILWNWSYLRYHVDARSWTWVLCKNKLLLTTELSLQGILCLHFYYWQNVYLFWFVAPTKYTYFFACFVFFFFFPFLWIADVHLMCWDHQLVDVQSLKLREVSKCSSFIDWTFLFSPRGWVGQW